MNPFSDCTSNDVFPLMHQDGADFKSNEYIKLDALGEIITAEEDLLQEKKASCVYDKNTNLVWQVKNDDFSYSWFNEINSVNGGDPGFEEPVGLAEDTCNNSPCNTVNYTNTLNNINNNTEDLSGKDKGLCQISTWRLPKLRELLSIMNFEPNNDSVLIDGDFFNVAGEDGKGTVAKYYWTSTPASVFSNAAWCIYFGKIQTDHIRQCNKGQNLQVRMVAACSPELDESGNLINPDKPC
jgi:hypothetical protein